MTTNVGPDPRSPAALGAIANLASTRNRALASATKAPVQSAINSGDPLQTMRDMLPDSIGMIMKTQAALPPDERDPNALLEALAMGARTYQTLSDIERDGRAQLEDGSYVSMADLNSPDPMIRAQATAAMYRIGQTTMKDGNALLVMAGLDPIPGMDGGAGEAAARAAQQDYQNRMAQLDAKVALDRVGLDRAAAETSRALGGLQESRGRADLVSQRLLESAPYNTGGKTTFGGGDLGALAALRLRQAGLENPEAIPNIVSYPTSITIDPGALMSSYDQALGVQGALPAIPSLLAGVGDIPGLPATYAGGGGGMDLNSLAAWSQRNIPQPAAQQEQPQFAPLVGYDQSATEGRLAY